MHPSSICFISSENKQKKMRRKKYERERERERERGGETSFYRFSSIGQVRDRKIQRKKKLGCFTCAERSGYASPLSLRPLSERIQAHLRRPSGDDPVAAAAAQER
jgi:hypothetical protein